MATLVLTTVGGAIGGPVGAAIGAVLGQGLDRALLFPAPMRTGPRLTELAVQTSSYGTPLPRIFGTMRVAGSVIWATDLIETRSSQRGNKGRPGTTSYSYAASFAVALSARPIRAVRRIWAEGKLLRGVAGDWKSATGFRLHLGGEDQAPDPLIASLVADAPAHRGIAYAVFEELQLADFGNRIPSLTFEVVADDGPVSVGAIARTIGEGAVTGDGPGDTVIGFAASGSSVAGTLGALQDIAQAWAVPAGGAIRIDNRAGAPRIVVAGARSRSVREPVETLPVALSVSHYDPARDYQLGVQQARRGGAGWREEALSLPAVMPAAQARGAAEAALDARDRARSRRRATLDIAGLGIAPGETLLLPGDAEPWRVTKAAVEGMAVTLDLCRLAGAGVARAADPGVVVAAPDDLAGATILAVFELPPLDDAPATVPQLGIVAAGSEAGWRAAALAIDRGGGSWEAIGTTAAPGVIGSCVTALGMASAALVDRRHVLDVALPHAGMALTGADAAAIDRGANVALIGDELVQFAEAMPLGGGRWRIGGFRRGRRGTQVAAHPPGTRFVLIERDALLVVPLPGMAAGDDVRIIAQGIADADAAPSGTTLAGVSVAPPSPVHLRAAVQADGSARLQWVRRSRAGWRWDDGHDAPLAEEAERYRVDWTHAGVAQQVIVETPTVVIPAAHRAHGPVTATVRQLGTVATSAAATIII